ncbi:SapC family protein [Cupriavidus basilensis]|uniref:SapC family protein n=1 Tax=Cupriavidus basilensis TaxID=68895 RepID=UPI0023E83175|nr:SapC family protein [Cupriavidus basilensis]MDF3886722.1 SapC family protein [Cupriavidus basilensis]
MPNYTVVTREAHANKRWQHNSNYTFAAGEAVVPVLAFELHNAVERLTLAFIPQGAGFRPVALLGLAPGENLFVSPDGRWLGGYVPAALRTPPFRLANTPEGQQVLCIDADSALLTDGPAGEAFFNADGTPAEGVAQVLRVLDELEGNRGVTAAACAALQAHQLIVPWDITVQSEAGTQTVEGLYKIDKAALEALPGADFGALRKSRARALAYCQLLSMQHLATLGQLARAHATAAAQAAQAAQAAKAAAIAPPARELDLEFLNRSGTPSFGGLV